MGYSQFFSGKRADGRVQEHRGPGGVVSAQRGHAHRGVGLRPPQDQIHSRSHYATGNQDILLQRLIV